MDVVKKEQLHCGFLQFYIQVYMWCWAKFGHKLNKTPLSKSLLTVCLKHNIESAKVQGHLIVFILFVFVRQTN